MVAACVARKADIMSTTIRSTAKGRVLRRRALTLGAALATMGASLVATTPAAAATGSADLSVSVSHAPSSPLGGEDLTFVVVATNDGPDAAADVVVGLSLNYYFEYRSATGAESCGFGGDSGAVICTVGSVPSGGSATVNIVARANSSGVFDLTGAVSSETPDPDSADRSVSHTVIVRHGPSQFERSLVGIYQQVLGRVPSAKETAYWSERWNSSSYFERGRVPLAIILGPESRGRRIKSAYTRILGRPATATDVAYWSATLARGFTFETVEATLIGSSEFARLQGSTAAAIVRAAYAQVLGRNPSAAEESSWKSQLAAGSTVGRLTVSLQRTTAGTDRVIREKVRLVLERTPTNFDRFIWLSAVRQGASNDSQWAELYAGNDYQTRFPYGDGNQYSDYPSRSSN